MLIFEQRCFVLAVGRTEPCTAVPIPPRQPQLWQTLLSSLPFSPRAISDETNLLAILRKRDTKRAYAKSSARRLNENRSRNRGRGEFSFSFFLSLFWFSTLSSAMDFRETGNCSRSKVPWEDNPDRGERGREKGKLLLWLKFSEVGFLLWHEKVVVAKRCSWLSDFTVHACRIYQLLSFTGPVLPLCLSARPNFFPFIQTFFSSLTKVKTIR